MMTSSAVGVAVMMVVVRVRDVWVQQAVSGQQ
jgi:hypothetical protein